MPPWRGEFKQARREHQRLPRQRSALDDQGFPIRSIDQRFDAFAGTTSELSAGLVAVLRKLVVARASRRSVLIVIRGFYS